jgi:DNA modification methylase
MSECREIPQSEFYECDGISIWNGACAEVLRTFPSASVDMVATDPPYLISYKGRWGAKLGVIEGDADPSWLVPSFAEIWRVLKPDSFCFSFYGWPHADLFLTIWNAIGFRAVSHIVCVKDSIGLGHYTRSQHEPAYLLAKGNPERPTTALSDVFTWQREPLLYHPTQKPVATIARIIKAYSQSEAILLDPFMGSGTTLIAARSLGQRAIGIEIDRRYCDAASSRLAQQVLDYDCPSSEAQPQDLFDRELLLPESEG